MTQGLTNKIHTSRNREWDTSWMSLTHHSRVCVFLCVCACECVCLCVFICVWAVRKQGSSVIQTVRVTFKRVGETRSVSTPLTHTHSCTHTHSTHCCRSYHTIAAETQAVTGHCTHRSYYNMLQSWHTMKDTHALKYHMVLWQTEARCSLLPICNVMAVCLQYTFSLVFIFYLNWDRTMANISDLHLNVSCKFNCSRYNNLCNSKWKSSTVMV